jgi:CheY-like chemotaxis protein
MMSFGSEDTWNRIIIITDNRTNILILLSNSLLSGLSELILIGFDNPVTALVEFKPNFYDLLLIEINMPLMDGFQLTQNLVRRDLRVKVIIPVKPAIHKSDVTCIL